MADDIITIPARRGKAARMALGQLVSVINTHGQQVVDTWAFNAADPNEFMSMVHSRVGFMKLRPAVGDAFISNRRRPILTLVEDSSGGAHDTDGGPFPDRVTHRRPSRGRSILAERHIAAALALHLGHVAAGAKAEGDLDDLEIVEAQQAQQSSEQLRHSARSSAPRGAAWPL